MESTISDEMINVEVRKAVEFLSQWPGVRRVWLFGSAAKGRSLDWRSDLDLAVQGMISADLCRAWSELDAQMKISVDLVLVESAHPLLREEIFQRGKVMYAA